MAHWHSIALCIAFTTAAATPSVVTRGIVAIGSRVRAFPDVSSTSICRRTAQLSEAPPDAAIVVGSSRLPTVRSGLIRRQSCQAWQNLLGRFGDRPWLVGYAAMSTRNRARAQAALAELKHAVLAEIDASEQG